MAPVLADLIGAAVVRRRACAVDAGMLVFVVASRRTGRSARAASIDSNRFREVGPVTGA